MFRANNFDKLLDKATSNLRLDPDWPTILQICDLIRQNDCTPKYAMAGVKKKLYSQNPHQAMFALLTLESIVKNCGSAIHDEVTSKPFCEMLHDLVKTTQHENLRNKILELIQAWAFAFRNTPKYRSVQDTVNILKAEGYKFPALKESDAMFSADTAPEWADGEVCHRCRVAFSLMVRRHHCRACGQVFCQQCSSKTSTLPKFGIEKEVRVCDACFDKVSRPPSSSAKLEIVDTSSDYGTAQPQKRPGKTAEELQEEEELQLALALSQSEAEQKEKDKRSRTHVNPNPVSLHPTVSPTPSSVSASPEHSQTGNAELSRYLDRNYWEQRLSQNNPAAPTAPASQSSASPSVQDYTKPTTNKQQEEDDAEDKEIDEFVGSLKSQVEIFVNRMKSNSSRGRSIANDTSVQTLFMNITAMHSKLLRYIQQQDDKRVYLESLQDKVSQIRDSRAALDTLRAEHAARLAAAAEAADRQRQMQMAAKLQAMRKKKHEYLQYQRQLALQRVQEQEREMQMRQEQQKHQYMMTASGGFYMPGVSMHQYQPGYPTPPAYANPQFHQMMPQATTDGSVPIQGQPQMTQLSTPSAAVSQAALSQQQPMPRGMQPQMGMQPQVLMQQMHQMRLNSQHGVHQMINQPNGFAQQNGQAQPMKQGQQNVPAMMPQMSAGQPNTSQPQGNPSNPMMAMQMQNMRMPMMTGTAPSQQVPGTGFIPNQPSHGHVIQQMPGQQVQGQQISNPQAPGQQMPGHQMPGQHMPNQPGQHMPNQPGQHMPNQPGQHMPNQPGQHMPNQPGQHMPNQPGQHIPNQPGQQMPNQQMPGQQMPNQQIPGQQLPNHQMPNQHMPNQQMPGPHMPNQQIPGQQIPSQQNPSQQITGQQLPGQQLTNQQIPNPQMPSQQVMPNMSVPSHVTQNNQNVPQQSQTQHMPQMSQGQPMPLPGQPMVAGPQSHMNIQMMPGHSQQNQGQPPAPPNQQINNHQQFVQQIPGQGQTSVPNQGQQMPNQSPMIQNQHQVPQGQPLQQMPGQQMKMHPQNYMAPGQPPPPNQQPPIKSESNNNTAELIRFD